MKLLKYIAPALMGLALVACDDKSDLGIMQTNPQEPIVGASEAITVMSALPSSGQIDLSDLAGQVVPVVSFTTADSVPVGATVGMELEIASNSDFKGSLTIPMQNVAEDVLGVPASDWDDAFRQLFGKAPAAKTNYVRAHAFMMVGSQVSELGYYNTTSVEVTPVPLDITIEEAYYLVGTANGWDLATAIKFEHSDKNVYDDPVFTLAIDVTAAQAQEGWWWKIVPESNFKSQSWDNLFGPSANGDTATSGNLFAGDAAGMLSVAGQQLFTIDMMSQTYSITSAIQKLYTPGNSNNWDPAGSSTLTTNDFTNYSGFLYINGEWLLTPAPNWDFKYGLGASAGTLASNEGPNLPVPAEGNGLYWTVVNIGSLTYNQSAVTSLGLIGDFNGWGGDVELTPSADMLTWTGEITFTEAGGWKIRANHDWAINLGGNSADLTADGSNLDAPAPGTYKVTLDLRNHPYSITLE